MELSNGTVIDRQNPQLHSLNDGTPYAMDVHLNGKVRQDLYSRLWAIDEELNKGSVQGEQRNILEKEKEQLIKDIAKMAIAYLMQSANGDATISIFYAGDVEHGSRVDYFQKYGLTSKEDVEKFFKDNNIVSINPENKYIPIQPKAELDYITMAGAFALPVGTVFMNANGQDKARYVIKQMGEKLGLVKEGGGKIILDGLTSKNGVMVLKKLAFRGNSKPYLNTRYNIVSNPYKHQNISEVGKNLSLISK